jgi:hypothetical protein
MIVYGGERLLGKLFTIQHSTIAALRQCRVTEKLAQENSQFPIFRFTGG